MFSECIDCWREGKPDVPAAVRCPACDEGLCVPHANADRGVCVVCRLPCARCRERRGWCCCATAERR